MFTNSNEEGERCTLCNGVKVKILLIPDQNCLSLSDIIE